MAISEQARNVSCGPQPNDAPSTPSSWQLPQLFPAYRNDNYFWDFFLIILNDLQYKSIAVYIGNTKLWMVILVSV